MHCLHQELYCICQNGFTMNDRGRCDLSSKHGFSSFNGDGRGETKEKVITETNKSPMQQVAVTESSDDGDQVKRVSKYPQVQKIENESKNKLGQIKEVIKEFKSKLYKYRFTLYIVFGIIFVVCTIFVAILCCFIGHTKWAMKWKGWLPVMTVSKLSSVEEV